MSSTREQWGSWLAFIMAAIGAAVGLGNLWRFPHIAYTYGGGAFIIPYLVALLTAGIPLLVLEFGLGHCFQRSAPIAFRSVSRKYGWVGWWATIIPLVGLSYYAVVKGWGIRYIWESMVLSWGNDAQGFFFTKVLAATPGPNQLGGIAIGSLIAFLIGWAIIYFVVYNGVKGTGTASIVATVISLRSREVNSSYEIVQHT